MFWHPHHKPNAVLSLALLAVALLGTGACAPASTTSTHHPGPPAFEATLPAEVGGATADTMADTMAYGDTDNLLNAGYKGITERYLETVTTRRLAISAIEGLAVIDPGFRLQRPGTAINAQVSPFVLYYNEHEIARFVPPEKSDNARWASLTTELLRTGRAFSPDLNAASADEINQALFDGMLSGLDAFSRYAGPEEARANRARRDGFGGIGIRFIVKDNAITITEVMKETPAEAAGLKAGDRIISISGKRFSGQKPKWVSTLLRGPIGSHVSMKLGRKEGGEVTTLSLHVLRAHIVHPTVKSTVDGKILTVRISSFNKNTASSLHNQLRQFSPQIKSRRIQGVVLDLRGNPGGLLMQSVNVADLFLESGAIVSTRGRHPASLHSYLAGGIDVILGLPMVVLIDGDSASAAEIVASALQDRGRAIIIGATSFGKGTAQTVLRMPNSGEVTLTWSRLIAPSGYALHGLGVLPTLCTRAFVARQLQVDSKTGILAAVKAGEARSREWREMGLVFDERRAVLRRHCPARNLEKDPTTTQLATNILSKSDTYMAAIEMQSPRATAERQ